MIQARCTTNLDNYEMIVKVFCCVPNIGDKVDCLYKGNLTTLRVCSITHKQIGSEPHILIELHN